MTMFVGMYLLVLTIGLWLYVFSQHLRGTHQLLSVRNVALLGFTIFQLTSALFPLWDRFRYPYHVADEQSAALWFGAMATLFIFVFMWTYERGFFVKKWAQRMPTVHRVPADAALWLMAGVFTFAAFAVRLAVFIAPILAGPSGFMMWGFAAISSGLVGWTWGKRLYNPVAALPAVMILLVNLAVVLQGAFGRRGIMAVVAGAVWGMYYSHFRYLPIQKQMFRLAVTGVAGVVLLAAFTSVREAGERERTTGEYVKLVTSQSSVVEGLAALVNGQDAAMISMWLSERFPESREVRPLNTVWAFIVFPVPRDLWSGKPESLSIQIPSMTRQRRVTIGTLKIGPGILGHAAAEGGWYAVIIYAFLGALLVRFFDQLLLSNPYNPFVVLAIGSAPGAVLGMARGETSAFAWQVVFTIVASYVTMVAIGKLVDMLGWGKIVAVEGPEDEDAAYWEWEDGYDFADVDEEHYPAGRAAGGV